MRYQWQHFDIDTGDYWMTTMAAVLPKQRFPIISSSAGVIYDKWLSRSLLSGIPGFSVQTLCGEMPLRTKFRPKQGDLI